MTKRDLKDDELGALFSAARDGVPEPDAAFLARLETDAVDAMQPRVRQAARGWLGLPSLRLDDWLGLGGLAVATLAGVWIGVAPPEGGLDPAGLLMGVTAADLAEADLWWDAGSARLMILEDG